MRLRGDERRIVTVLFADLVGYTALSESMDPEQVKHLVDVCFERLVADIDAFGGRVDKIIGDAIVALFGAPVAHEDDAERAVRAALRMHQTLGAASSELGTVVRMRIGVNSGEVLVGALRAGGDYTAMGDVVNTASRLQTAASPGEVLVGEATFAATRRSLRYEAVEPIALKGKEGLVSAWRATDAVAPPGYRPDRNRAPLVGRQAETGLLRHSIDNAVGNARASLVLVLGEAGVGKSRLAEELAARAQSDHDALVLEGRCVPYGEANVWWPVADALRRGCGIRAADSSDASRALARASVVLALGEEAPGGDVERVLQGLAYLMGYESELHHIDATRAREQATEAVVRYAEGFASQRPVILVLSDLHWADDLVLGLVETLMERMASQRFVVLATARPTVEESWQIPHGRHNLVILTLDPLSSEASAQLLRELAGEGLGNELTAALLARSDGNPFFLEELVSLLSDSALTGAGDAAPLSSEGMVNLPDTLRGLVAARLDALAPAERRLIEDCAVLGRRGSVSAIRVMARVHSGIDEVGPLLESLQATELMTLSEVGDESVWAFRSDLVREVAYGMLTKADRARTHEGIAMWLEENEDPDSDATLTRLAYHYVRAAQLTGELNPIGEGGSEVQERAFLWLERAAARASDAEISLVAKQLYSEGIELLAGEPGERHRAFLCGRARASAALRDMVSARADARGAIAEARAAGPDARAGLGLGLLTLAEVEQKESNWEAAELVLLEAAEIFMSLGDPRGEAEVLRWQGFVALGRQDYEQATELLEQALARFEQLNDRRGIAWARQNLGWCAHNSGQMERAEVLLRRSAATFEDLGDEGGLRWAQGLLGLNRLQQGYFHEADGIFEELLQNDRGAGDRWGVGQLLILSGSTRLWTGRANGAIERAREAQVLFQAIDDREGLAQADWLLARALLPSGRLQDGIDLMEGIARDHRLVGARVSMFVQLGDVEGARAVLAGADEPGSLAGGVGAVAGNPFEVGIGFDALLLLMEGDVAGAVLLLTTGGDQSLPSQQCVLALVYAAAGSLDDALLAVAECTANVRGTYFDHMLAGIARGMVLTQRADHGAVAVFEQVTAALDLTEDKLSQAIAGLARAISAEALPLADAAAQTEEASRRLAALGLGDTAWRPAFRLAAGLVPVA